MMAVPDRQYSLNVRFSRRKWNARTYKKSFFKNLFDTSIRDVVGNCRSVTASRSNSNETRSTSARDLCLRQISYGNSQCVMYARSTRVTDNATCNTNATRGWSGTSKNDLLAISCLGHWLSWVIQKPNATVRVGHRRTRSRRLPNSAATRARGTNLERRIEIRYSPTESNWRTRDENDMGFKRVRHHTPSCEFDEN